MGGAAHHYYRGDVTQIVYALDAQAQLVARDSTSQHPAAPPLPDIGYMRQLNAEGILALKPTLVLASALAKPSLVLQQVADAGVTVVEVSGDNRLDAITDKIATIGKALQREQAARALIDKVNKQRAQPQQPLPVKVLFIMAHGGLRTRRLVRRPALTAQFALPAGQCHGRGAALSAAVTGGRRGGSTGFGGGRRRGLRTLGGEQAVWALPGLKLTPAGQHHALLVIDEMALLSFGLDTPGAILRLRHAAEAAQHD